MSFSHSLLQLPALHLSSRLDRSSHLLLSICCYVVRGYVAPSCILHGISCSIIHDNPHDAYLIRPYTTLTHMHALAHALHYYLPAHAILLIAHLQSVRSTFISSTYAHTHTYMQERTCRNFI